MQRTGLASLLLLLSCANSTVRPDDHPTPSVIVFVAPTGDDSAAGTREAPYRTLGRALAVREATEVVASPGTYVEPELLIDRPVHLFCPSETERAVLDGHLVIRAAARLLRLDVLQGLTVENAAGVVLESGSLAPAARPHTLVLRGASLRLVAAEARCGAESCLEIRSSSVTVEAGRLEAGGTAQRVIEAESATITLKRSQILGGVINQLSLSRTRAELIEVQLRRTEGAALAAVRGSSLWVARSSIEEAQRFGVVLQASRARVEGLFVESSGIGLGLTGAQAELRGLTVLAGADAALSVGSYQGSPSTALLKDCAITHKSKAGVLVSAGRVRVEGCRFLGEPAAKRDGDDAITVSGVDSELELVGATIDGPAGFGVSVSSNALATITATITRPRLGGILFEGTVGGEKRVLGGRITGCRSGSGIVAQNATDLSVVSARVSGCPEAGLLAGEGAQVEVTAADLTQNGQFGIGAFGGSTIQVRRSRVSGSVWAVFATCGDGARVEDLGGNLFKGQVTTCP